MKKRRFFDSKNWKAEKAKAALNNKEAQGNTNAGESRAETERSDLWVAQLVHEESTGVAHLGITFENPLLGRQFAIFDTDLAENPEKLRLALRKAGADLTGTKAQQLKMISEMLDRMPAAHGVLTGKPGFRKDGFVLGHRMIGAGVEHYKWRAAQGPTASLGMSKGTLDDWQKYIAAPLVHSTVATFSIGAGLGASLPGYLEMHRSSNPDLPVLVSETAGFNISGESGSGKTTNNKIVSSLSGPPILCGWDFTPTSLEERAASRNDLMLPLDDTETYTKDSPTLGNQLRVVNQKIPEGQSRGRSQAVDAQPYANLTFRTFVISSSPKPIDDIAVGFGRQRSKGEIVRYPDIAVPKLFDGGIFDELHVPPEMCETASSKMILEIEGRLFSYYGTAMPAFLFYLLGKDRTADVVRYWRYFLEQLQVKGWEERFAKKFAIAYAADMLAIDAGILPWPRDWPFKDVMRCYRRAQAGLARHEQVLGDKMQNLRVVAKDQARFPVVASGKKESIECTDETLGVITQYKGQQVCALRKDRLKVVAGSSAGGQAMLSAFVKEGVLIGGHGKVRTSQLPIPMKIGGKVVEKPRFYVFDLVKLGNLAATKAG